MIITSQVMCACRALRREILDFDLVYPLEVDMSAGPAKSLHYYLYSDSLEWKAMRMDPNGIPRTWTRTTGINYWPGYIAWYALVELGHYVRGKGTRHLDSFLKQIDWLEDHAVCSDGSVVWAMNFDNPENEVVLRAPWTSAHAQGLAISAVVRGWRVTKRPNLLDLLQRSWRIFDLDVADGGIRARIDGNVFYTEVPGGSLPGILDGFMTSLLGLHDLYVQTRNERIGRLLSAGVEGLKKLLPRWNYRNKWSWYGCREYLCPPAYHSLNRALLHALGKITGNIDLIQCAEQWNPVHLSRIAKAEVYLAFLLTKNRSRIRHRTWMHYTIPEEGAHRLPILNILGQTLDRQAAATGFEEAGADEKLSEALNKTELT